MNLLEPLHLEELYSQKFPLNGLQRMNMWHVSMMISGELDLLKNLRAEERFAE